MTEPHTAMPPSPVELLNPHEIDHTPDFRISETCGALAAALAVAQSRMQNVLAEGTGEFQDRVYRYADLAAILNMAREPLASQGLAILQLPHRHVQQVRVTTLVWHGPSGEWLCWRLSLPLTDEHPQSLGSAITYARRYMLVGLLNVAADYDDDCSRGSAEIGPFRRRGERRSRKDSGVNQYSRSREHQSPETVEQSLGDATAASRGGHVFGEQLVERESAVSPERRLAVELCRRFRARNAGDYTLLITTACDDPLMSWNYVKSRPDLVHEILRKLEEWCQDQGVSNADALGLIRSRAAGDVPDPRNENSVSKNEDEVRIPSSQDGMVIEASSAIDRSPGPAA